VTMVTKTVGKAAIAGDCSGNDKWTSYKVRKLLGNNFTKTTPSLGRGKLHLVLCLLNSACAAVRHTYINCFSHRYFKLGVSYAIQQTLGRVAPTFLLNNSFSMFPQGRSNLVSFSMKLSSSSGRGVRRSTIYKSLSCSFKNIRIRNRKHGAFFWTVLNKMFQVLKHNSQLPLNTLNFEVH
jgi:hypothetical protein